MKNAVLRVILGFLSFMGMGLPMAAEADVTVQQKISLDVASAIRMHGSSTSSVTGDKRREDSETHCEGMMSLVCGNVQSGEIVRLDRDVTWQLEPSKKRYKETVFATPEETAAMRARMQAKLEKMRSCPVSREQPAEKAADRSKCEMSPPKIDVRKTEDKLSIAGHDARRTIATLTETCTDRETGDVCDTVVAVDLWLTQDKLPGSADRHAFEVAYAKKLGIDDAQGMMRDQFARFLAPYQPQIKQLTDKSNELKGQPLRTSLRVLMGGQQCAAAKKSRSEQTADGADPMADVAKAGKQLGVSVGHLVGGLFHKKNADAAEAAGGGDAGGGNASSGSAAGGNSSGGGGSGTTPVASAVPDPYAQYVQLAAFTTETVAVNTDPVPAERFDVPADWKKELPKPAKDGDDDFVCPKN